MLDFPHVDAGDGWLIFKLPPAEMGIHPASDETTPELYLLCDDVEQTRSELIAKNVPCSPVQDRDWGRLTAITLPSGAKLGMYEPRHSLAIGR